MSKVVEFFLNHVELDAEQHEVEFRLVPTGIVGLPGDPGYECAGYFTVLPKKIMCVATGKPQAKWLPVLVHEYAHFRQYIEDADAWNNNMYGMIDGEGIIDNWIHHRTTLSPDALDVYVKTTLGVELDAEKRAVETIKKFGLPIDEQKFIQKANSSLMFYGCIPRTRSWFDYNPFDKSEVYEKMPTEFLTDSEYVNLTDEYWELYQEYCFKSCTSGSA
jgi:hypothetical protein